MLARLRIGIPRQTLSTEGVGATGLAPPAIIGGLSERRTSPVELLWDLVFVFAVTQVTTLIANDLTWGGFAHGMIVLALVWWAWSAFVWAANAEDESSRALRAMLLLGMLLTFIAGLCVPSAFGTKATLFALPTRE